MNPGHSNFWAMAVQLNVDRVWRVIGFLWRHLWLHHVNNFTTSHFSCTVTVFHTYFYGYTGYSCSVRHLNTHIQQSWKRFILLFDQGIWLFTVKVVNLFGSEVFSSKILLEFSWTFLHLQISSPATKYFKIWIQSIFVRKKINHFYWNVCFSKTQNKESFIKIKY